MMWSSHLCFIPMCHLFAKPQQSGPKGLPAATAPCLTDPELTLNWPPLKPPSLLWEISQEASWCTKDQPWTENSTLYRDDFSPQSLLKARPWSGHRWHQSIRGTQPHLQNRWDSNYLAELLKQFNEDLGSMRGPTTIHWLKWLKVHRATLSDCPPESLGKVLRLEMASEGPKTTVSMTRKSQISGAEAEWPALLGSSICLFSELLSDPVHTHSPSHSSAACDTECLQEEREKATYFVSNEIPLGWAWELLAFSASVGNHL